jgi:hypothetical protein
LPRQVVENLGGIMSENPRRELDHVIHQILEPVWDMLRDRDYWCSGGFDAFFGEDLYAPTVSINIYEGVVEISYNRDHVFQLADPNCISKAQQALKNELGV